MRGSNPAPSPNIFMKKSVDQYIEDIAKEAKAEGYLIQHGVRHLIDDYREELIKNYIEGAGFEDFEVAAGCKIGTIGEGDGYVVITKSRKQALKAMKAYWRDTAGDDFEEKEEDFIEGMLWTYKRPEHEGGEFEFYYDFASKHPHAKKCFYIYL